MDRPNRRACARATVLLLVLLATAACGQKGDLYLPGEEQDFAARAR